MKVFLIGALAAIFQIVSVARANESSRAIIHQIKCPENPFEEGIRLVRVAWVLYSMNWRPPSPRIRTPAGKIQPGSSFFEITTQVTKPCIKRKGEK